MINLISMAGRGERFIEQGYSLPKPLIPINGVPMIWKVIDSLPPANKWIFIVRQEHIEAYSIDEVIKQKIPDAIITVDKDLLGGASIFCAEQYIPEDEEVFIAGCDLSFIYDKEKFEELKQNKEYDCILLTFTKDKRINKKPEAWGYVVLEEDNFTVKNMSVKVPISNNPFEDHIAAATFWLRSKKVLYDAIRKMIEEQIKTNNEYYLDNLPLPLKLLGKKSCIFDIKLLISWGTPEEFHEFEKLDFFYRFKKLSDLPLSEKEIILWKEYFKENESD